MAANLYGTAVSSTAQLTVNVPLHSVHVLTNQVVEAGQNVVLAFAVTGTTPISYSWQFNGAPLSWTDPVLVITNIQPAQEGYYQVAAANVVGSISSLAKVSIVGPASRVVAWGDNSGGQTNVPAGLNNVVAVAGGDLHTIAVRTNGTLVAWGDNSEGQSKIPPHLPPVVFLAAGAGHNLAIGANGSLWAWGGDASGQCNIPSSATNQPLAVSAGDAHSLALLADGTVIPWGDDTYGQTDLPDVLTPVYYWWGGSWPNPNWVPALAIAAGRNHNLAVLDNGTLIGWGDNSYGQINIPADLTNATAVAGGYLHSVGLRADGTVVAWGDDTYGQTNVPPGLTNVIAVAAGDFHTVALLANGKVIAWGDDSYGQTDIPSSITNAVGIAAGYYHSLALLPPFKPLSKPK
jgi:alpha-tubulin suppressor-like RCC1 family protein